MGSGWGRSQKGYEDSEFVRQPFVVVGPSGFCVGETMHLIGSPGGLVVQVSLTDPHLELVVKIYRNQHLRGGWRQLVPGIGKSSENPRFAT